MANAGVKNSRSNAPEMTIFLMLIILSGKQGINLRLLNAIRLEAGARLDRGAGADY